MLTESTVGSLYELEIKTAGVLNPEEAINTIKKGLYKKFKVEVIWAEVRDDVIRLQISGSPFAWAMLLAYLPVLLTAIGVTILLIIVYLLFAAWIPRWIYGLSALSLILLFVGPRLSEAIKTRIPLRG